MNLLAIVFVAILANNIVLNQFLGICPYLGVSKRIETSLGMGMAVIFVMTISSIVTWIIDILLLQPFDLVYLRTIAFILVIAGLVQLVETVLKKTNPTLFRALGIYLPLITTNCTILGVALLNVQAGNNIIETIVYAISVAVGFTLALVIMAGIRERLELATLSSYLRGAAVSLVTAGILSLAFMGFKGMMTL
ncbi:MAG TPA: electron transport complex subunit RsxA [Firmicutes bacterium]|jgi:electron transport complex protein RnfA|nr:electron transport complex subunit RsxA [Bacillota bacterium]HAA33877.1 electron transport complex subunit RsxA [Bacillota bacterium]